MAVKSSESQAINRTGWFLSEVLRFAFSGSRIQITLYIGRYRPPYGSIVCNCVPFRGARGAPLCLFTRHAPRGFATSAKLPGRFEKLKLPRRFLRPRYSSYLVMDPKHTMSNPKRRIYRSWFMYGIRPRPRNSGWWEVAAAVVAAWKCRGIQ